MALPFSSLAQDYSRKQGRVTDYELRMQSYEKDSSAAAVILCETTNITYTISLIAGTTISQQRYYYMKAKVLRQEGSDVADIEIPYYSSSSSKETVSGISASSYNLVDGKRVETQLKRQYIFNEQVSANVHKVKFSIPDVKAGSIVEIKYTIQSDIPDRIDPIVFQHKYPLVYGYASIAIPQYFRFKMNVQGYHFIKVKKGSTAGSFNAGGHTETYTQEVTEYTAEDLPALKDEGQVWCPSDFRSAILLELDGYDFPGSIYKPVTTTWASVYENLKKSNFSYNLKVSNPFKTEVAAILSSTSGEMKRLSAIHKLVTSRMAWNEYYRLIGDNVRSAADKGSGNSAEINFALNSALKAAGFQTTPILLNPRHYGRLPITRPSMEKINAFIIRVTLSDGSFVYLDGTSKYSAPNVLPTALMVDRARIYGDKSDNGWVNLTNLSSNIMHSRLNAKLEADGKLSGRIEKSYKNLMAMKAKRKRAAAPSEEKYIENLEEEDHIEISDYSFSDTDAQTAEEKFNFSMQANIAGDFIYLNASIIPFMSKNPLSQQERKLPVEFSAPDTYVINCTIELPEGYKVEEFPKGTRLSACDNGVSFQYMAKADGNMLNILLTFNMNRILYSVMEYPDLRSFFGMASSFSMSNIVLKKAWNQTGF